MWSELKLMIYDLYPIVSKIEHYEHYVLSAFFWLYLIVCLNKQVHLVKLPYMRTY